MDFKLFFDQIDESVYRGINDPTSVFASIRIYEEQLPSFEDADIAIIGVTEDRGTPHNKGVSKAADEIRKAYYRLKKGKGNYRIIDLGNLRCGIELEETYLRLKEVIEQLLSVNTIPLIIGGSHDIDYGQFLGYENTESLINVVSIDSFLDMEGDDHLCVNRHHTHKMMIHEPNYLFHFSNIGYQSFLSEPDVAEVLEKLNFDGVRLGLAKEKMKEVEPIIRNADMLSFDISAVKFTDAPGNHDAQPFGFSGEEACQLTWYAGYNNRLTSLGIYEYNPELDNRGITAKLISTMIWYMVDGFYSRVVEEDFDNTNYTKYIVSLQGDPHSILFYKSRLTEKWWMEVPYPTGKEQYQNVSIVPCSYSDYELALKGEVPDRWMLTHAKLI